MSRQRSKSRNRATGGSGSAPREIVVTPPPLAEPTQTSPLVTFGSMLSTYIILLSGGFALLRSSIATVHGGELSIDRALFTVINAISLTGFEQTIGLGELRVPGQIAVFVLILAGTLMSLVVGGTLVTRIVRLPYSDRQIITAAGIAVLVAALLGAIGLRSATGSVWYGVFAGVSALGNSGAYLGRMGDSSDPATHLILLPLAIAGGVGLPVLMNLVDVLKQRRPLVEHSVSVLSMSAGLYIGGLALLFFLESGGAIFHTIVAAANAFLDESPDRSAIHLISSTLMRCSAAALNSRTAGFPLSPIEQFTRASQWILMALMMVGAAPGGTGGGLKVTTPLVLLRGVRRSYAGHESGRAVAVAAVWTGAYGLLVFAGLLSLLISEPQIPADRLLLLTISAASNVGLAHNPVSIVGPGLFALGAIAMLGRILPLCVLYWMARAVRGADVAVG